MSFTDAEWWEWEEDGWEEWEYWDRPCEDCWHKGEKRCVCENPDRTTEMITSQ